MRWKKFIFTFLLFALLLVAAVAAFLSFFDFNRLKPLIAETVQEAIGRKLTLDGDLRLRFTPVPEFALENIRLQNVSWGLQPDMLSVERLKVRVALLPLLLRKIEIRRLALSGVVVLVERGPQGKTNLEFETSHTGSSEAYFRRVLVRDAVLKYWDHEKNTGFALRFEELGAKAPDPAMPLDFVIRGAYTGKPFQINGTIGPNARTLMADEPISVTLKADFEGASAEVNGSVDSVARGAGVLLNLKVSGRSIADLLQPFGLDRFQETGAFHLSATVHGSSAQLGVKDLDFQTGPLYGLQASLKGAVADLVTGGGAELKVDLAAEDVGRLASAWKLPLFYRGPLRLAGRISTPPEGAVRIHLEQSELLLAESDLAATATVELGGRIPQLTATLSSKHLDLRPLFHQTPPAPQPKAPAARTRAAKPSGDADRSAFTKVAEGLEAQLELQTGKVLLPDLTFVGTRLEIQLQQGRMIARMQGPELPDIEEVSGVKHLAELGGYVLTCRPVFSPGALSLSDVDLQAGRPDTAKVTLNGIVGDITNWSGVDLAFTLAGENARQLQRYLGEPWPPQGPYRVGGRMVVPNWKVHRFETLEGRLGDIDFTGAVLLDVTGSQPLLAIEAAAPRFNLQPFHFNGFELPSHLAGLQSLGPLQARVNITDPDGRPGLAAVDITIGTPQQVEMTLKGNVSDLSAFSGAALEFNARGADDRALTALTGIAIPFSEGFRASATFRDIAQRSFRFDDLRLGFGQSRIFGSLNLDASGERPMLSGQLQTETFDLSTVGKTSDAAGEASRTSTPRVADGKRRPFPFEWQLPSALLTRFDADVQLAAGQLAFSRVLIRNLNGSIRLLNAVLRTRLESPLITCSGVDPALSEFCDVGKFAFELEASVANDLLAVRSFRFNAGGPQSLWLKVDGGPGELEKSQRLSLRFEGGGDDVAYLRRFLAHDIPFLGPYGFSGTMLAPSPTAYRIDDFQLALGGNLVRGWFDLNLDVQRPRLEGLLQAEKLDLRPVMKPVETNGDEGQHPPDAAAKSRRVFSTEPLPLEWVDKIDLKFTAEAGEVLLPRYAMQNFRMEAAAENGLLEVSPLRFNSGGGTLGVVLRLKKGEGSGKVIELDGRIDEHDIGVMMDQVGLSGDLNGTVNARATVSGSAESIAAFMGGLDGTFVVAMQDGRINNKYIGRYYSGLGTGLLELINPMVKKEPFVQLNCLVHSFDILKGKATYAGLLDTNQTTIVGAGDIDLKTERLNVTLSSVPKEGVRLKGLGSFAIGWNSLSDVFKLRGTLADPSLGVDPQQTMVTLGKVLGGIATLGPFGIAAIFADIKLGKQTSCTQALKALQPQATDDTE
jgi:uncharacterized protein involved in outer membrane biogenesis